MKTQIGFLKATLLTALTSSLFIIAEAQAAVSQYQTAPGASAKFEAVGRPSMLKIKGKGAEVTGNLELNGQRATGKFELDLNQFETGMGLRDRHMKEKYLETNAHPKALLEITEVALPSGFAPGTNVRDAKFKGRLTVKGVTKPIEGTVNISGPAMATEAKFTISLTEFPIGVPSYMGVTVADSVHLQVSIPSFVRR